MGKRRFVSRETAKLELSEGDWIEVKEGLSYGEQKRLGAASLNLRGIMGGSPDVSLDLEKAGIMRMALYIVDWSFVNDDGKPVKVTPSAIGALEPATAQEIEDALDAHLEKQAAQAFPEAADEIIAKYQRQIADLEAAKNAVTPG